VTKDKIIVANAGDSRAVLAKLVNNELTAIDLSIDHKPDLDDERNRIEECGGYVDMNRVNGVLALSRAIGDHEYKITKSKNSDEQMVICHPEV
jgi:serine/threonine protein phosphatase PrpC